MRLIFSRDRAAQLDLLLRSLRKHVPHEQTRVIWSASDVSTLGPLWDGYWMYLPVVEDLRTESGWFDRTLRRVLLECPDETVTFFCDDDVVFDNVAYSNIEIRDDEILTFSLRLGSQNTAELPDLITREGDMWIWDWHKMERTDFGFPGSIDGHTFRVDDVWEMIGDWPILDPTELETVLVMGCEKLAEWRPLMACFAEQKLVGVPVNRVADRSGCLNGEKFPQSTSQLNDRFLAGERIDLDALDFSGVEGCHHEIEFKWRKR